MKIQKFDLPKSAVKVLVEAEREDTISYYKEALEHLAKHTELSGFRAGKVPMNLVRQKVGEEALKEEAVRAAVSDMWKKAVEEIKDMPLNDPQIDIEEFDEEKGAKIVFEYDTKPVVNIGNWKKIKIKAEKENKVEDKEVDQLIESFAKSRAKESAKSGESKKGDKLEINFEGSIENVRKDKLSANKFPIILGDSGTIPGFDDNLTGLKKGDKKEFDVDFPKDHFDDNFKGKKAHFEVEVLEVFELDPPKIDDEFAKTIGQKTLPELKDMLKKDLQKQRDEESDAITKTKWLDELEKLIKTEIPESLIRAEVQRMRNELDEFLNKRNLKKEDWLSTRKMTEEALVQQWEAAAEKTVRVGLGLMELAKEENVPLPDNEAYQKFVDKIVKEAVK